MSAKKAVKLTIINMLILAACCGCQSVKSSKVAARLRLEQASVKMKLIAAEQYYENAQYAEAEKAVNECMKSEPNMPQAHLLLGKIMISKDDLKNAEIYLRNAVELDQTCHEGWYQLGVVAAENGLPEQACGYFEKADTLAANHTEYIIALAGVYAEQGKTKQAVKFLEKRMAIMPNEASLKVAAADLYMTLGESKKAIQLYDKALSIEKDSPQILVAMACCHLMEKEWSQAAKLFEKAATMYSKNTEKTYLRYAADCSLRAQEYIRASKCYDRLSVEDRSNPQIWLRMAQAALGAGAIEVAYDCSEKALLLKPGWSDALLVKGCVQYIDKKYGAALQTFKTIEVNSENGGIVWLMTGRCYEKLGKKSAAEHAYGNAAKFRPEYAKLALSAGDKK